MRSERQRRTAMEAFVRLDRSCADAIAGLGYPIPNTPRVWWRGRERTGEAPVPESVPVPRRTGEMARTAPR